MYSLHVSLYPSVFFFFSSSILLWCVYCGISWQFFFFFPTHSFPQFYLPAQLCSALPAGLIPLYANTAAPHKNCKICVVLLQNDFYWSKFIVQHEDLVCIPIVNRGIFKFHFINSKFCKLTLYYPQLAVVLATILE